MTLTRSNTWTRLPRLAAVAVLLATGACSDDGGGATDVGPDVGGDVAADTGADNGVDVRPDGADDTDREPIICRPCTSSVDCELPGNACINLPSGESVCGVDCSFNPEVCPEGTFCANVGAGGEVQQCVPESLFCDNQCGDPPRECELEGEVCDPLTGLCGPPLGLCEPCSIDEQCGQGNLCLTFPDEDRSRACGRDCAGEPCPAGYACANLGDDGTERQCVPEVLTCIDRCTGVECPDDLACDPLTGECAQPRGLCDSCQTSAQCGANNLCLTLADGNPHCGLDCGLTAPSPGICPPGFVCQPLGGGISQCVPTLLVCIDHCEEPEEVVCPEGFNCDPVDGTCQQSTLSICESPCDNSVACGAQDDLCVSVDGGLSAPVCAADCDDDNPCPIGYSCFELTDGLRQQCAPTDIDLGCDNCVGVECPDGEACRPVDGSCLPEPTACDTSGDCPTGELCDIFESRCEPVGLPCRHREFFDCGSGTSCSATSEGLDGVCLQECSAVPEGCPDYAPACESFYRIFIGVCVERGLGGPESCGRFADSRTEVGRPCPFSEDDDNCGVTASFCLTDVAPGIPGFCSMTCDPTADDPCPVGGTCERLPGTIEHYCMPADCRCLAAPDLSPGEEDVVQTALDQLGLTRCDISYGQAERDVTGLLVANDPFRVELAGDVRNEALFGVEAMRRQVDPLTSPRLDEAIRLAARNLGYSLGSVALDPVDETFCDAIQQLWTAFPEPPEAPPECPALAAAEAAIPPDLLPDVIEALVVAERSAAERDRVVRDFTLSELEAIVEAGHRQVLDDGGGAFDAFDHRDVLLGLDTDTLYLWGLALAETLGDLRLQIDRGEPAEPVVVDVRIDTPRGLVVIQGDADHVYCADADTCDGVDNGVVIDEPVALLIDTGGDDTYLMPAAANMGLENAVSVLFDLGGDDLYGYVATDVPDDGLLPADAAGRGESPRVSLSTEGRQGSARGGYAFLFDRGLGADVYESLNLSQGFGLLGVGALVDDGCDAESGAACPDVYRAEALSQGAGLFGVGILMTGSGSAEAQGWHLVQGAAGPLGAGLLVDWDGDDVWRAEPGTADDALFEPPVLASAGNWSVAQGAAIGVPSARPVDGGNVSGGVGALVDLGGDDTYVAGVMAQGGGYWHGLGLAVDTDGADDRELHGFGQGAGLDYGVGLFGDALGADVYNADANPEPRVLGGGENFGVGLALDEAGGDEYHAAAQSLGHGFLNGTGVFVDNDGNDSYILVSEETLGKATLSILGSEPPDNPRRTARTVGLFVDAGGTDLYTGRSLEAGIANDAAWIQRTPGELGEGLIESGVGADRIGGTGLGIE